MAAVLLTLRPGLCTRPSSGGQDLSTDRAVAAVLLTLRPGLCTRPTWLQYRSTALDKTTCPSALHPSTKGLEYIHCRLKRQEHSSIYIYIYIDTPLVELSPNPCFSQMRNVEDFEDPPESTYEALLLKIDVCSNLQRDFVVPFFESST